MGVRIVFGVMSATQSAAVVDQLARALAPHPVVVHHDFAKRSDFALTASNARFVADPKVTGWGTWGFSEAILHTIRFALERYDFDYFQLLSPTCLPIRPIAEFEAHVAIDPASAHVDLLDVEGDDDVFMTFGYRTYLPSHSLRFRVLQRARRWYFGNDSDLVQAKSLSILRRRSVGRGRRISVGERAGFALTKLAAGGGLGAHPFGPGFRPMIGGVFFGARREVCEHLSRISEDENNLQFFRGLKIVDETLFPTLLANSGYRLGPSNHAINTFTPEGSPRWIEPDDLERLFASHRFFARKFVDDVADPMRRAALQRAKAVPVPDGAVVAGTGTSGPGLIRPRREPRIVFGLMSSMQPGDTVAQLVRALRPYPVVVHHDFSKRRDFVLDEPNAHLVPDPKVTGWGTWGFVEAIFHTIRFALETEPFDYFQLISPTCLPIRPLGEFAQFVMTDPADVHADIMSLESDPDTFMTFGYRAFIQGGTLRFRLLRSARKWYFGDHSDLVQTRSLSILRRRGEGAHMGLSRLGGRASLALTRLFADGPLGSHPFGKGFRPMIGSTWWGARRTVCEHLERLSQDETNLAGFRRLHLVDETVFASLFANSQFRVGPSNHAISAFNDRGNPRWIDESELDRMFASQRFFARKFPEDPEAPQRRRALERAGVAGRVEVEAEAR